MWRLNKKTCGGSQSTNGGFPLRLDISNLLSGIFGYVELLICLITLFDLYIQEHDVENT